MKILSNKIIVLFYLILALGFIQKIQTQTPGLSGINVVINRISTEQGLSNSLVLAITQDKQGFIWIGTGNGLNRFDGQNFTIYTNDPDDSTTLSHNKIRSLFVDRSGTLWIGTEYGLNRFDPATKTFKRYFYDPGNPSSLSYNNIRSIFEDRAGVLWIGTAWGLNKFERTTETWTSYLPTPNDSTRPGDNFVNAILEDHQGNFWIGTGNFLSTITHRIYGGGLHKFDRKKGTFSHYWHNPSDPKSLSGNWVYSLMEDGSGNIWVTVDSGYINILDKVSETFKHLDISFSESDELEQPVGNYTCICEDNKGAIWISTWGMGLFRYDRRTGTFNRYTFDYSKSNSLSSPDINTLFIDKAGLLWIGTERGGVNTIATKPFLNQHTLGNSLLSSRVDHLFSDKQGGLWISTIGTGLWRFDPRTQKYTHILLNGLSNEIYRKTENEILFISTNIVDIVKYDPIKNRYTVIWSIPAAQQGPGDWISHFFFDNEGILWVGTHGGSLYRIKANMKEYTVFVHDPLNKRSITGGQVGILQDRSGNIWVGTAKGLNRFDKGTQSFTRFIHDEKDSSSLSNNYWCNLFEDKSGTLWVGTLNGLNRFNKNNSTFTRFFPTDHHAVNNILEDGKGRLWHASEKGISMFDPATGNFRAFDKSDGIDVEVLGWNLTKMKSGEFVFGTVNGILIFHPDSVKPLQYIPPIVITGLKKSNQPINLAASPELVREITLEHEDNVFSIEFAALSYDMPGFNQYAYMLEGFEKEWVYCGNRREATYTNLNPGVYTFRVKGSNHDGVWNETGTSITIIINPPWWKTWWAYLSYGVLVIFSLYGLRRYELNRLSFKNQVKMDEVVLKEREETDKIKSRFFANISHEFRTPLTLIIGPAEKINSQKSNDIIKDSGMIKRSAKRLLQLVNQLLDLSKLEAGKLKLEASKGNIVSFVKGIALSFESLAEEKDITLKILPEKDLIELYFDKEKMIKILSNILSNAFKFTPEDGKITVAVAENDKNVEIKIRDTGIGIPKEEIPKLFNRFYQVDSSFTKEHEGTGIGLALTKELVELHHGSISVESERGQWTEFTVIFPLGRNHLKDEEILKDGETDKSKILIDEEKYSLPKKTKETLTDEIKESSQIEEKTIILVVEDNYDMREYIKESLGEDYLFEEAINGEQGVTKAEKIIPDLIISDMMMPKMDGNELTRILKNDEKTSHIPIILLTAKSGQESKLEGLETGADDYLTKPFDIKELQIRIKNLINLRKKLQEKFSKIEYRKPKTGEKKLSSIDEKFMLKVTEIIEKHISKEEFSIEDFGNVVGMSRMQIHRKLKALTGKSASRFIRSFRLERAKEILSERNENISEIAYSLGFGSPAYFTRCFKEEFGYPPSDLKN